MMDTHAHNPRSRAHHGARSPLYPLLKLLVTACALLTGLDPARADANPPNVVLIYFDDLGYGDFSSYGGEVQTPNLDRLSANGIQLDRYYAPSSVCSPSRAGVLTGCYPQRIGVNHVFFPHAKRGLNSEEETIADLLKPLGYATACFGKWHLGHRKKNLPLRFGFDHFYGIPYSADMWPFTHRGKPVSGKTEKFPGLHFYTGDEAGEEIDSYAKQKSLTKRFTDHAVTFINQNKDTPFFLYLAHPLPHVPLAVSEAFEGRSGQGLYADVLTELDASVGRVREALRENGLSENTLLIVTSDNGPWLQYGNWGGSAGPLREGKTTTFEGGHRVPCLIEMPGTVPAGIRYGKTVGGIDLLPTICALTGARLPKRKIDGKNLLPILKGNTSLDSPHEYYYFYGPRFGDLQAVSKGDWKLHLPHGYHRTEDQTPPKNGNFRLGEKATIPLSLFYLGDNIGENVDVSGKHPDIVTHLQTEAERFHREIVENRRPLD